MYTGEIKREELKEALFKWFNNLIDNKNSFKLVNQGVTILAPELKWLIRILAVENVITIEERELLLREIK